VILIDFRDEEYGARGHMASDPEGRQWYFATQNYRSRFAVGPAIRVKAADATGCGVRYHQRGVDARRARMQERRTEMTLCPIALVAGCKKCPVFAVCPLKGVIGDYKKEEAPETKQPPDKPKP